MYVKKLESGIWVKKVGNQMACSQIWHSNGFCTELIWATLNSKQTSFKFKDVYSFDQML